MKHNWRGLPEPPEPPPTRKLSHDFAKIKLPKLPSLDPVWRRAIICFVTFNLVIMFIFGVWNPVTFLYDGDMDGLHRFIYLIITIFSFLVALAWTDAVDD